MQNGISAGYDEWTHHGESCDVSDDSDDDDVSFNDKEAGSDNMNGVNDDDDADDDLDEIKENFTLRTALLWTINDFTAYSMLTGWSVKGYNACPICMNETSSSNLSNSRKVCYMGHQRFLPSSHQWQNDKMNFDGTRQTRKPIIPMSGLELLHDIDCTISEPCCSVKKRKHKNLEGKKGWKKRAYSSSLSIGLN
ncbi:leucine-rich repeat protein [Tanacetum coccineum]